MEQQLRSVKHLSGRLGILAAMVLLSGCVSQPLSVDPFGELPDWTLEQFQAAATVTTVRLPRTAGGLVVQLGDRHIAVAQPALVGVCAEGQPDLAQPAEQFVRIGVTPWAYPEQRGGGGDGRVPVGLVEIQGERLQAPVPPYWALTLDACGRWGMAPQAAVSPGRLLLALGGFYPLVRDGAVAAHDFPGRGIRAARVAIGGLASGELLLVAASGSRPGSGAARAGLTTAELAALLVERYEVDWALNLDGGRSALLQITTPSGVATLPERVFRRRPGPVSLRFRPVW